MLHLTPFHANSLILPAVVLNSLLFNKRYKLLNRCTCIQRLLLDDLTILFVGVLLFIEIDALFAVAEIVEIFLLPRFEHHIDAESDQNQCCSVSRDVKKQDLSQCKNTADQDHDDPATWSEVSVESDQCACEQEQGMPAQQPEGDQYAESF